MRPAQPQPESGGGKRQQGQHSTGSGSGGKVPKPADEAAAASPRSAAQDEKRSQYRVRACEYCVVIQPQMQAM